MQELICGSRLGNFTYYSRPELSQDTLSPRHYVVGSDNILLQHPSISASVCSYVDVKSGTTNIIAGGEGAVYFINTPVSLLWMVTLFSANLHLFCK